ncbi:MAG: prepilin-type N-terminal cleavage/methylation domain-containing protein [Candidatus Saccharimonas sp.]
MRKTTTGIPSIFQFAKIHKGFTIVELAIVIAVIGILATITVVSYRAVQDKSHDTAVQSDLSNIADQYELYYASKGVYPYGDVLNNASAFSLDIKKASYDTSQSYQLLNCTSSSSPGSDYAILAVSKSGKKFYTSSLEGGVRQYTGTATWLTLSSCTSIKSGFGATGAGYSTATGWRVWTSS